VLALAVLASAADEATFLFVLQGVPVGTVELRLEEGRYTYRSKHLFTRARQEGAIERQETRDVSADGVLADGKRPESLWLWRAPGIGCVSLVEELTGRVGQGCVEIAAAAAASGRVFGQPFEARYRQGRLEELSIGAARFTAIPRSVRMEAPPDLFGAGFPTEGRHGPLALVPAAAPPQVVLKAWDADASRALAERVHDSFSSQDPSDADWMVNDAAQSGGCLAHARRFQEWAKRGHHAAAVVFGLLADGERAYPHAWVRIGLANGQTLDLDPMSLEPVRPETHLPLSATTVEPGPELGQTYLELVSGTRRVRFAEAMPRSAH
jgi:hypothetical protein